MFNVLSLDDARARKAEKEAAEQARRDKAYAESMRRHPAYQAHQNKKDKQ